MSALKGIVRPTSLSAGFFLFPLPGLRCEQFVLMNVDYYPTPLPVAEGKGSNLGSAH